MGKSSSPVRWLDTTMQEFPLQFSISVSISISCFSICPVQLAVAKQAIRPASKYILAMYILLVYAYYGEHPVVVVVEEELFRG